MSRSVDTPRGVLFDAYGTLFRLEGIEAACATALLAAGAASPTALELAGLWRAKQLKYSIHRSLADRYVDFAAVTAEALDFVLARYRLNLTERARGALLDAWRTPPADPTAADVLAAVAPLPCAILSNGSPAMLAAATRASGLDALLAVNLSADAVRVYKPSPRVYALGVQHFGRDPAELAFVSANGWDAVGAAAFGYRVCWINRLGAPIERHGPAPEATVPSLAEVPAVIAAMRQTA